MFHGGYWVCVVGMCGGYVCDGHVCDGYMCAVAYLGGGGMRPWPPLGKFKNIF